MSVNTVLKPKISLKVKISSIAFVGIIIQVLATQGILMYNFFNLFGVWEIKKLLHPLGLILVLLPFLIKVFSNKKNGVTIETITLFSYLFFQYVVVVYNHINFVSFLYSVREVVVLFIIIVAYQSFVFSKIQFEFITKLLLYLVIVNIFFVLLNIFIGGEAYMMLMTGRFYWPFDPLLKFKISTFIGLVSRSPGLIGESTSVGYFGVFSYFFISHSTYRKYLWIPLVLVFLSFTRSAYMVVFIYAFLQILTNKKYFKIAIVFLPVIIGFFIYLFYIGLLSLESLWMRIDNWINKVDLDSDVFFGGNLAHIGSAAPIDSGFAAIMDSYWLFLYHGLGLVGISLILYFLIKKIAYTKDNLFMLIGLLTAGLFVTYTQSIPFLVFLPLLAIKSWWKNEE